MLRIKSMAALDLMEGEPQSSMIEVETHFDYSILILYIASNTPIPSPLSYPR